MRILGWIVCGVGYLMLSMSARDRPRPQTKNGRDEERKQRKIAAGVHMLVLQARLRKIRRSIQQDYTADGPPDNVLMHNGMLYGIFRTFASIKGLTDHQIVRGFECIEVHDLIELVMPGGDRPKYKRSELSRVLRIRLKQLTGISPPTKEEWKRERERRHRRNLPYMRQIVDDEEVDPDTRRWALERFRYFYLSDSPEARLVRECDRLSDAFLAASYAEDGEAVQQFLIWGEARARDPVLAAAMVLLRPYYAPKG